MSWLSALGHTARAGFAVERRRLEPLSALRGALGLAFVVGVSLWLFSPAVAASSAFGAYQAAIATFQRSWRPRPQLALVSGATLGISTFLGYLSASHLALFLALLAAWAFLSGLSWAAGPTVGVMATSNVAIMLITITLPSSVAEAAWHAAMSAFGGLVQAALLVLFPFSRWRPHRDALADALAAEADYARRLRHDPHADFDPEPLMEAREAAQLTPASTATAPPNSPAPGAWPNASAPSSPPSPIRRSAPPPRVSSATGSANCSPPQQPYWTPPPAPYAGARRWPWTRPRSRPCAPPTPATC